jgi:hypothetical protein
MLRNARRASAFLSADELAVLWLIKSTEPHRPGTAGLVSKLQYLPKSNGELWTDRDVRQALARLGEYPTKSGLKQFLGLDAADGWGIENI